MGKTPKVGRNEQLRQDVAGHERKVHSLREKLVTQDKSWRDKVEATEKQLALQMRQHKHAALQLQVRNAVLVNALGVLENLCKLMRNALTHRTCPACNDYPCNGTSAQCNLEMYAAHRGKTVEQVTVEADAKRKAQAEVERARIEGLKP